MSNFNYSQFYNYFFLDQMTMENAPPDMHQICLLVKTENEYTAGVVTNVVEL